MIKSLYQNISYFDTKEMENFKCLILFCDFYIFLFCASFSELYFSNIVTVIFPPPMLISLHHSSQHIHCTSLLSPLDYQHKRFIQFIACYSLGLLILLLLTLACIFRADHFLFPLYTPRTFWSLGLITFFLFSICRETYKYVVEPDGVCSVIMFKNMWSPLSTMYK